MKNSNELQAEQLKGAMAHAKESTLKRGELSDDDLDSVAGGAVLNSVFYIAKCKLCGWQSPQYDGQGESDAGGVIYDHIMRNPNCSGDFEVYQFDSRNVNLG